MGAGASLQEDVPTGWHALAAMAEAADKPDLVAKIVRENQIDAATALKLDDDDLRRIGGSMRCVPSKPWGRRRRRC